MQTDTRIDYQPPSDQRRLPAALAVPFDDLLPGATFTTRARTITECDIVSFASLTGDWHPQHVDREWAADSAFGERIAHGALVLACAIGLVPFDPEYVIALRRLHDVKFKRPVRIGDTIHVEGRISAVRPLEGSVGLAETNLRVLNHARTTVLRADADVLWRCEADAGPRDGRASDPAVFPAGVLPL